MEEKIKELFQDIFYEIDLSEDNAIMLKDREQELLKEAKKQALIIASVSQRSELLPDFLVKNSDGKIVIGFRGGVEVDDEWEDYLKKLGNCG